MRSLLVTLIWASASFAAERIDNVLLQLVPRDTVSLFGAQMDQVKNAPLFQKMVAQQKLPQLDAFAAQTNFDPRRDVRELLIASGTRKNSSVLLARGSFRVNSDALTKSKDLHRLPYRNFVLWVAPREDSGFCILDSTLAIAGSIDGMHAALDRYRDRGSGARSPLLQKALGVPTRNQVWLVSEGSSDFLANNVPDSEPAVNFARIFRNLESASFQADLSRGLSAQVGGVCKTDADAKALRDAARGLVGFGRLSVPDSQPQLLRVWDAFQITQQGRSLTLTADIPADLVEKLLQLLDRGPGDANGRSSAYSSGEESHRPKSKSRPH